MNFINLLFGFDRQKSSAKLRGYYAILETSYAEYYNTKDVYNEVLYHPVDFENFRMFGLMYMKRRRDNAAVMIDSVMVNA
jgi:hypothetical protein